MSEAPSVRESLAAARDSLIEAQAAEVNTPEPVAAEAAQAEQVAASPEPNTGEEAKPTGAQDRDENGRFKPKASQEGAEAAAPGEAEPKIETAKPAEQEPQSEAIPVPPSLSAAVKAQWNELPEVVRKDIAKLEQTVQTAKAEWGKKGERLNRYDEIIGPHLERWQIAGLDGFQGIQTLLAAQAVLDRNPVEGLAHIARSYGVDLRQLAGQPAYQQPGAEGHQAPTAVPGLDAYLNPLKAEVATLRQQNQQFQQSFETQKQAEATAEVEAFRSDPKNLYFDNVRNDVAARLGSGSAKTLAEAYEQAIWASPEVRPLLLAEQTKAAQAQASATAQAAQEAQRRKAETARHAAGSIAGSPAPGARPPQAPTGSVRETILAAMQEHGSQV